jgi:type VI secretion system secreted protein Hcp
MAVDVYLQIDGIKGESQDDKHKDRIEVTGIHWGDQPRSATASTGGGHTAERAELSDISFSTVSDSDLTNQRQHCAVAHIQSLVDRNYRCVYYERPDVGGG